MSVERAARPCRQLPESDRSIPARGSQKFSIGRERETADFGVVAGKYAVLTCVHIPNSDRSVFTSRSQVFTGRREFQLSDQGGVTRKRHGSTRPEIQNFDCISPASYFCDKTSVLRKNRRSDTLLVTIHYMALTRNHIRDSD